jgi:hypothetical protein
MKADERLERAYRLCDGFLRVLRVAQAVRSINYERQPEPIGAILERVFKKIQARGEKGETL